MNPSVMRGSRNAQQSHVFSHLNIADAVDRTKRCESAAAGALDLDIYAGRILVQSLLLSVVRAFLLGHS